jgi:hypothetical protein
MTDEVTNSSKWIHRVSQDDDLISVNNPPPRPNRPNRPIRPDHPTHRRFKIKEPEYQPSEEFSRPHKSVIDEQEGRTRSDVGRIRKGVFPALDSSDIGRVTGDWTMSLPGRVFVALVEIGFIVGVIWGGIYLWKHQPHLLILAVIVILLLWGIISEGLRLGEGSLFKQDASWAWFMGYLGYWGFW